MVQNKTKYRLIALPVVMLLSSVALKAQNKPGNSTQSAAALPGKVYTPAAYPSGIPVNYVRSWEPQQPYSSESDVTSSGRTVEQVHKATQYVDGLGRPLQAVSWQTAPGKTDIVAPVVYDAFGREAYKFLPYTQGTDGSLKTDPFNSQLSFYTNSYKTEQLAFTGEQIFFGKTEFESSPLSRPLKTMAPGNSWAGNDKGVTLQYLVNSSTDAVRIWTITFDAIGDNNIPASTSTYEAGQLYKTVTLDEAGRAVVEYKDKDGHVVLKKVQVGDNSTIATDYSGTTGFLCTYYVYDDLSQLRFVIPPKAVANLQDNNWQLATTVISELCFRYEYDERQRMIAKKVPGAGWIYMVYDKRDRLVYTQDANMRSKNWWHTTLYDNLNRPIQTAMLTSPGYGRATLQSLVNGISDGPTTVNTNVEITSGITADLSVSQWQTGVNYQASNSVTITDGFTSGDNAEYTVEIVPGTGTPASVQQTANTYPVPTGATLIALTYTHYDNYNWTSKQYKTAYNSKLSQGNSTYSEPLPTTTNTAVQGLVTGTRVRVLEDAGDLGKGKWLESASFYDSKGRVVQVQTTNYKGGEDAVTSLYDFTGKVLSTYQVHSNASAGIHNQSILTVMDYDHAGRVTQVRKTINDDLSKTRVIAQNSYDALGQLKTKQLGQKTDETGTPLAGQYLETQDYAYNIRGWLKGINWDGYGTGNSKTGAKSNRWFAFDLSYDWGYEQNQYNGNIAGMRWQTGGDQQERSYGYGYDNANRLLYGDFKEYRSGWNNTANIDFSMKMGDGQNHASAYDENGNIKAMFQVGLKGTASTPIDNLGYSYNNLSNKLAAVTDAVTGDNKLGDFTDKNSTGDDYAYDDNGNLTLDKNKNIQSISYNHLNLPYQVTVRNDDGTAKGTITYIYDATGNKIEKRTDELPTVSNQQQEKKVVTTYLGNYVYENSVLQFFSHEEGRVRRIDDSRFTFDYFLKDHLGNVRMMLTDEHKTDQYPVATLEAGAVPTEKNYYSIDDGSIVPKNSVTGFVYAANSTYGNNNGNPPYNTNNTSNVNAESQNLYKINGSSTNKTGLGITLKVMAGDKLSVYGKSYYFQNNTNNDNNYRVPVDQIIMGLLGGAGSVGNSHNITSGDITGGTNGNVSMISDLLNTQATTNNATPLKPRAYINYLLFDEQFTCVGTGTSQVGTNGEIKDHNSELGNIAVSKNGYIYVYCSNESPVDVFFDNLQVVHGRGPVLEETHYYPFGLTMAGISSKVTGGIKNDKKFTSQEFNEDLALNWYEFKYRMQDPQLGRFWQIDPLSSKYCGNTTYSYAENKVTIGIDLEGLELLPVNSAWFRTITQQKKGAAGFMDLWTTRVDIVAKNVPTVFKDASGAPLISAMSVSSGPSTGASIGVGGNLPASPGWTWGGDDGLKGVPDDLYRFSKGTDYYIVSSGGGSMPYSGANQMTRSNDAFSIIQEGMSWIQLYRRDKPIWDAYANLKTNREAYNNSVALVNLFEGSIAGNMNGKYNQGVHDNLVNFVQDGTLPNLNFNDIRGSLESSLTTMWYGIQILNASSNTPVQQSTLETYNILLSLYNALNPTYNFNLTNQKK